ncbi:MAG: 16S rRNA (guanine(527)-N(7))-methyltransferase RsmG [Candidatus Sumerlaeaceae bacterium]|jgi:16S rRNA (guanine527-N7)-methyltransferase
MDTAVTYRNYLLAEPWIRDLVSEDARIETLATFMAYLIEENQRHNLTAIRDPQAIAKLHFADSLAPLRLLYWFSGSHKAADIGAGAGFPVIPLAVSMSACRWYAVESIGKKAAFLRRAVSHCCIENVEVLPQRAEQVARSEHRGTFDVVTARAVGAFASLCEIGVALLRKGGRLVLFKTEASFAEAERTSKVLGQLGAELREAVRYRLGGDHQDRVLFVVERVGDVPERFPREHAKAFKHPLA